MQFIYKFLFHFLGLFSSISPRRVNLSTHLRCSRCALWSASPLECREWARWGRKLRRCSDEPTRSAGSLDVSQRIVYNCLKLWSWSWIIVVYCHISFLCSNSRKINLRLSAEGKTFSLFVEKVFRFASSLIFKWSSNCINTCFSFLFHFW